MKNISYSIAKIIISKSRLAKKLLKSLQRFSVFLSRKIMEMTIAFSELTRTEFELRHYINLFYDNYYMRRDYSSLILNILKEKLIHLDVGSRKGPLHIVQKYSNFMEIIMVEPEREEANDQRKRGFAVIEKPLFKKSGEVTFLETRFPACSSIYMPQGPYLDFINPDPGHISQHDVVKKTTMECSTISEELINLNVPELDFLKIDTQGSELDILMGLKDYRPLIIQVEMQYLPVYHDVPNAYQICQYLFERGYIPFSLTTHHINTLCPIEGDGYFMPSWVAPLGIELIRSREQKYIALMLMFGQTEILKFVNQKIQLKNQNFIQTQVI